MERDHGQAADGNACGSRRRFWRGLRVNATHSAIGGVLIAATGFSPEEWFACIVEHLYSPNNHSARDLRW
jgi:hypothetical protein